MKRALIVMAAAVAAAVAAFSLQLWRTNAGWRDVFADKPIRLAHPKRNQGDVNLAELAVLATAAASASETPTCWSATV